MAAPSTSPGRYELYRSYVKEFDLPVLRYPHRENMLQMTNGRMVSEQEAVALKTLQASGYNQREIDYVTNKHSRDLTELYLGRYIEKIRDEYQRSASGWTRWMTCRSRTCCVAKEHRRRRLRALVRRFSAPRHMGRGDL